MPRSCPAVRAQRWNVIGIRIALFSALTLTSMEDSRCSMSDRLSFSPHAAHDRRFSRLRAGSASSSRPGQLAATVADHVAHQDASRAAVREALARPEVQRRRIAPCTSTSHAPPRRSRRWPAPTSSKRPNAAQHGERAAGRRRVDGRDLDDHDHHHPAAGHHPHHRGEMIATLAAALSLAVSLAIDVPYLRRPTPCAAARRPRWCFATGAMPTRRPGVRAAGRSPRGRDRRRRARRGGQRGADGGHSSSREGWRGCTHGWRTVSR